MRIQLLGSIGISMRSSTASPLRSERTAHLLALLAWQPNAFVPDRYAVEHIWEDNEPERPRAALYTCASRLRQSLADPGVTGASCVLSRQRGGYVLRIDPVCVDLHLFRTLTQSARVALQAGHHLVALERFDQALALERGAPIPELRSSWSDRARYSVVQEILAARIEHARLALALGRHTEVVPVFFRLADEHPLDEAIAEILIRALYLSGRQWDAIARFGILRKHLVEHLGQEPASSLSRLHELVLRRDPSLETQVA
ncbi:AfsR/SARP family transcriptional regulator [Streptomyces sp. NPDC000229]|uniref:AfsR/SARP family transcriptional regulator n=1 Tax=Streptomyces sp. NPDC000229 TaxID=3154247 RepID=UPI00332FBC68